MGVVRPSHTDKQGTSLCQLHDISLSIQIYPDVSINIQTWPVTGRARNRLVPDMLGQSFDRAGHIYPPCQQWLYTRSSPTSSRVGGIGKRKLVILVPDVGRNFQQVKRILDFRLEEMEMDLDWKNWINKYDRQYLCYVGRFTLDANNQWRYGKLRTWLNTRIASYENWKKN